MSQLDKDLLAAFGLTVADASHALRRSPQALYRGLGLEPDYFEAEDLAKLYAYVCKNRPEKRSAAFEFVARTHGELTEDILMAPVGAHEDAILHAPQIWFFCANFDYRELESPSTWEIMSKIIKSYEHKFILLCSNSLDIAKFNAMKPVNQQARAIQYTDVSHMPTLLFTNPNPNTNPQCYIFADQTLDKLSDIEARRILKAHFVAVSRLLGNAGHTEPNRPGATIGPKEKPHSRRRA